MLLSAIRFSKMKPLLSFLPYFEGSQNAQIIMLQNCQYPAKVAMKTVIFHPNPLFLRLSPSFQKMRACSAL